MRCRIFGWAMVFILGLGLEMVTAAAQTCHDDILATAPDSRFSDNGNGTVTDLTTGLIWKQCAEGLSGTGCASGTPMALTWQQALQQAAAAVFAGSYHWRLPNKNELASLVESRCIEPAINARFFPNTPAGWFWSSSPFAYDSSRAWIVGFGYGDADFSYAVGANHVRLVGGVQ